jgi:hypothetical protein
MCFRVFLQVCSNTCFKCSICLQIYVANVLSACFKSRSGCCTCCNARRWLSQGFASYLTWHALPSPLLSSLPFPPSRLGVGVDVGVRVVEGAAFERKCWRGMGCGARGHGVRYGCKRGSSVQTSPVTGCPGVSPSVILIVIQDTGSHFVFRSGPGSWQP